MKTLMSWFIFIWTLHLHVSTLRAAHSLSFKPWTDTLWTSADLPYTERISEKDSSFQTGQTSSASQTFYAGKHPFSEEQVRVGDQPDIVEQVYAGEPSYIEEQVYDEKLPRTGKLSYGREHLQSKDFSREGRLPGDLNPSVVGGKFLSGSGPLINDYSSSRDLGRPSHDNHPESRTVPRSKRNYQFDPYEEIKLNNPQIVAGYDRSEQYNINLLKTNWQILYLTLANANKKKAFRRNMEYPEQFLSSIRKEMNYFLFKDGSADSGVFSSFIPHSKQSINAILLNKLFVKDSAESFSTVQPDRAVTEGYLIPRWDVSNELIFNPVKVSVPKETPSYASASVWQLESETSSADLLDGGAGDGPRTDALRQQDLDFAEDEHNTMRTDQEQKTPIVLHTRGDGLSNGGLVRLLFGDTHSLISLTRQHQEKKKKELLVKFLLEAQPLKPLGTSKMQVTRQRQEKKKKELLVKFPLDAQPLKLLGTSKMQDCAPLSCPSDPSTCLVDVMFCDGIQDCPGREDEAESLCVRRLLQTTSWLEHLQSVFSSNNPSKSLDSGQQPRGYRTGRSPVRNRLS